MCLIFVFFFNDPATTEIYTLSLHDALPICAGSISCDRLIFRHVDQHAVGRSEEHTSELQSQSNLVCRLLLEKKTMTLQGADLYNDQPVRAVGARSESGN